MDTSTFRPSGTENDQPRPVKAPAPCSHCGRNPARGHAFTWTAADGFRYWCHDDTNEDCLTLAAPPDEPYPTREEQLAAAGLDVVPGA